MRRRTVRQRLQDVLDAADRIETYLEDLDFVRYAQNAMVQDAVERNIERLSEACRHIPDELTSRHPEIPWRAVRDIGNVLRHGYDVVDKRAIWNYVSAELGALRAAAASLATWLDQQPDP